MEERTLNAGRNATGLSLVEVLVALFLLALGLLAAAPLFVYATRSNATGAELGTVGALGTQRMEILRAVTYSDLTPGGSLTANSAGYFDTSNPDCTVRWQIANNASPAGTRTVNVRAFATRAAPGPRREVTLTTLRSP